MGVFQQSAELRQSADRQSADTHILNRDTGVLLLFLVLFQTFERKPLSLSNSDTKMVGA
jgi:hypothetical protein